MSIPEGATHKGELGRYYKCIQGQWFYSNHFGCWRKYYSGRPASLHELEQKPTWSGPQDGLPPAGTVCESMWNESRDEWFKVKVFGANEHGQPIFRWEDGVKKYEYQASPLLGFRGNSYFRAIRTPAQLAAEQRETAIREFMDIVGIDCRVTASKAVDAGFKREVV